MLEAPGRVLPRPMSLCQAPPGELAFLLEAVGPGTRALAARRAGRRDPRLRPARQRLPARRRAAAPRRRRHRRRALPVPLRAARRAAGDPRLPQRMARGGRGARPERRGRRRADPRHGARCPRATTSLACGPEPMLEAVRELVPGRPARLGGADGLRLRRVLRLLGRDRRRPPAPLRRRAGPGGRVILERLRLPRRARSAGSRARARRLRDEDRHAAAARGQPRRCGSPRPRRGMLNSIGLENPGIEALPRRQAAAPGASSACRSGSPSAASRASDYAEICAALDDRDEVAAIELNLSCPNVEEAPESAAEIVAAARPETREAALREALAGRDRPARDGASRPGRGRRRALAREHDRGLALDEQTLQPRARRTAARRLLRPGLKPIALAAVYQCYRATGCRSSAWAGSRPGRDALEFLAAGATRGCARDDPLHRPRRAGRVRAELAEELAARACRDRGRPRSCAPRRAGRVAR